MATTTRGPDAKPGTPHPSRPPVLGGRAGERDPDSREHRSFPRAEIRTHFQVTIPAARGEAFSASLHSVNLSVSGVFLESTFFLPVGKEVLVAFELPGEDVRVRARAVIVREERGGGAKARSGFALRFLEFFDQTEVALAKLFLGERLRAFAGEYLKSRRARVLGSELDRVTDALAAWELLKITSGHDVWEE